MVDGNPVPNGLAGEIFIQILTNLQRTFFSRMYALGNARCAFCGPDYYSDLDFRTQDFSEVAKGFHYRGLDDWLDSGRIVKFFWCPGDGLEYGFRFRRGHFRGVDRLWVGGLE